MAAFNSLGSTLPVPSVSNKLNASLISSISSSVNPGLIFIFNNKYLSCGFLETGYLEYPLLYYVAGTGFLFIAIKSLKFEFLLLIT